MAEPRIRCLSPFPDKQGANIPRWKYDLLRHTLLKVIPANKEGMEFARLSDLVEEAIPVDERKRLGSLMWHVTSVKLDLEARHEIERIPGSKPQRLRRVL